MNCDKFKKNLALKLGDMTLADSEQAHVQDCPDCMKYYENLKQLDDCLSGMTIENVGTAELAQMVDKLDNRIERFLNRAIGFYRFGVRYGVSVVSIVLIMFISMTHTLVQFEDQPTYVDSSYSELITDDEYTEDEGLAEEYIELLINNYSKNYGYNSGEMIIGELEAEEFEYLLNNLDVGDIL